MLLLRVVSGSWSACLLVQVFLRRCDVSVQVGPVARVIDLEVSEGAEAEVLRLSAETERVQQVVVHVVRALTH